MLQLNSYSRVVNRNDVELRGIFVPGCDFSGTLNDGQKYRVAGPGFRVNGAPLSIYKFFGGQWRAVRPFGSTAQMKNINRSGLVYGPRISNSGDDPAG